MVATWPRRRLWTKTEYYEMGDLGIFDKQRVELIAGEVIQKPRQSDEHAHAVTLVSYAMRRVFATGYVVLTLMPMNLGLRSLPEPDVAVMRGHLRSFTRHPKTAELVVEVSDSTLAYDCGPKASLYARSGIHDYWIINLTDQCLEVRRRIVADRSKPFGFRYDELHNLEAGDFVAPLALPRSKIGVADLLP